MAEFDEDKVAGCDGGGDGDEVAFDGVGASGAAGYGGVDDRDFEGVVESLAPAWWVLVEVDDGDGEGREVPFVPLPPPPEAIVESPAR